MGICFKLKGKNTLATSLLSSNGVRLTVGTHILEIDTYSAQFNYLLLGSTFDIAIERKVGDTFVNHETKTVTTLNAERDSSGTYTPITITVAGDYRVKVYSYITKDTLEYDNPSDFTLSSPFTITTGVDKLAGSMVEWYDFNKYYLIPPRYDSVTGKWWYYWEPRVYVTFSDGLGVINGIASHVLVKWKVFGRLGLDTGTNSVGFDDFASPASNAQDRDRTTNAWVTDKDGMLSPSFVRSVDSATRPPDIYIQFMSGDDNIANVPVTSDFLKETPVSMITTPTSATVLRNDVYSLPATAVVTYTDDSTATKTISWDKTVDTSLTGTTIYTASYTEDAVTITTTFTLIIKKRAIGLELEEDTITVLHNGVVARPTTAKVIYDDNSFVYNAITWSEAINTSVIGVRGYVCTCVVDGVTYNDTYTVTVIKKASSIYIGYIDIAVDHNDTYYKPPKGTVTYSDGSTGLVDIVWDDTSVIASVVGVSTHTYRYTENGVEVSNTLSVITTKNLSSISLVKKTDNISQNSLYVRDDSATATYSDGTTGIVNVMWDVSEVDTTTTGEYIYTCKYTYKTVTKTDTLTLTISNSLVSLTLIKSVEELMQFASYTKPKIAIATYSDNTEVIVDVVWDNTVINTSVIGTYTTVASYTDGGVTKTATLTVNVHKYIMRMFLPKTEDTVVVGSVYTLPTDCTVMYSNNTTKIFPVTWDKVVDTSKVGTFKYIASFSQSEIIPPYSSPIIIYADFILNVKRDIYPVKLTINNPRLTVGLNDSITRPTTGIVKYSNGTTLTKDISWDKAVNTSVYGNSKYTAKYSEHGIDVYANLYVEVKDYDNDYNDLTLIEKLSENTSVIENREFDYELFERVTHGEFLSNMIDISGYDVFQPTIKYTTLTDKRIMDMIGINVNDKVITFKLQHKYLFKYESLFLIDNKPLDLIDPAYRIYTKNDYVYIYSKKFKNIETISELKVIQATRSDVLSKSTHTMADYKVYTDNFFRKVITSDGRILDVTTSTPGLRIDIEIPHIILSPMVNNNVNVDFNKIYAKRGICYTSSGGIKPNNESSIYKMNKFTVINNTLDTWVYIPYMNDIYDKSYYESFFKKYKSLIPNWKIREIPPLHKKIQNMKLYLDHTSDYFNNYLKEIYKYDSGVYEQLLLDKYIKRSYFFSNLSEFKDGDITIVDKVVNNYYSFDKDTFLVSVYDIDDTSKFEIYINNRLLHRNPSTIIRYGRKKYIYISQQAVFENIRDYIIGNNMADETDLKYMRDDEIYDRYRDAVLANMNILVKRRRNDYRVFHTGLNPIEKNLIELPSSRYGTLHGMQVFVDGLRLSSDDYYLEDIAGIRSLILKRKYNETYLSVSITYYINPITFIEKEYSPSKLLEIKVPAEGDDIFIEGHVVTPDMSYSPNSSQMIMKATCDYVGAVVSHIIYSDVKEDIDISTDYRGLLMADNNIMDTLLAFEPIRLIGKSRLHNQKDIEQYIYYLKYILGSDYEPEEIYTVIDNVVDLTPDEKLNIKNKYTTLFSESEETFDANTDKDYPSEFSFGNIRSDLDVRAKSYKETIDKILLIFKGNYIKATENDDIVYNMNYIGQHIL